MEVLVKKQTSKDQFWLDEKGIKIPYNRTTALERKMENKAFSILKKAVDEHNRIKKFKRELADICSDIYDQYMSEKKVKPSKGNFTWYNFNRTIKIEASIKDRIEFDDLAIEAAKAKLQEFLDNNVEAKDQFIKDLVLDAFQTSRGKLDVKKVLSLVRYRSKIKSKLFQEAVNLIEEGIRRPDSKMYFRIWQKNPETGKYEDVQLNFSSITI